MAKFFFSVGLLNKKLLLPLMYIILYTFIFIFWHYYDYNDATFFIENFGTSIGQILSYFLSLLFRYRKSSRKKKKVHNKKYIKNYLILLLIDILYIISNLLSNFLKSNEEKDSSRKLYINDAIEIIFLTIVTYFILKYKYYIHHIISIILIALFAIIIDILLNNFSNANTLTIINSIFYISMDSIIYIYFKYLIESKYYYFMDVLFMYGIFNLGIYFISFLIILGIQNMSDNKTIIFVFYNEYRESGVWIMIARFFFGIFLVGFLVNIFEFIILYKLTPNYVIISFAIGRIPASFIKSEGINKWIILIIGILQTISLLFYLEIFEYNFCSLNKNTKRNILERENNQRLDVYDNDDEIVIKGYDISEIMKKQEKEMNEKNEEDSEEY